MSDNYAVIDGKKVKLTDEQLKALGVEIKKKRNNPFERVDRYRIYSYISAVGRVINDSDSQIQADNDCYDTSNYFNDPAFAKQVALHQLLYRKLLKFAYDNEYEDSAEWGGNNSHWAIRYNNNRNKLDSFCQNDYKARDVYFSSEEGAERAIYEVVEPFMKEHPDFVW